MPRTKKIPPVSVATRSFESAMRGRQTAIARLNKAKANLAAARTRAAEKRTALRAARAAAKKAKPRIVRRVKAKGIVTAKPRKAAKKAAAKPRKAVKRGTKKAASLAAAAATPLRRGRAGRGQINGGARA